jgi:hypothetical protein
LARAGVAGAARPRRSAEARTTLRRRERERVTRG